VVEATPGLVVELDERPPDSVGAWRRGARWRAWSPGGERVAGGRPVALDLEDAVVVAQLARERAAAPTGGRAA
jgi:hypothetical protein